MGIFMQNPFVRFLFMLFYMLIAFLFYKKVYMLCVFVYAHIL